MAMIIGQEGHHLNYTSNALIVIINESQKGPSGSPWLPLHVFVVDENAGLPLSLRPFNDLLELASHTSENEFLDACRLTTVLNPLIILYTSGTLGTTKGVLRTTASFFCN